MKRTSVFVCSIVGLLTLSSCGGDDVTRIVSEDRLDGALLTLENFDADWAEQMRGVFTSRTEGPQSLDPTGWCTQAQKDVDQLGDIEVLAGDSGAAVEFRHARQDVRRMFHGVSQQVWSNENVEKYFDVVSKGFDACMGETWSPEPGQEVTITPYDAPEWGDQSLAVNIAILTPGPDGDYVWASRLVIVVVDSSLMIVRDLDVQLAGGERFMTDEEWNDLVDVAVEQFTSVVNPESTKGGFLATDPFFSDVSPAVAIG